MDNRELADQCRALSDPNRVRIFTMLHMDLCVGALAEATGLSESAVSQHLSRLRAAGLVVGEKRSYWTHYRARTHALRELGRQLAELADGLEDPGSRCCCSGGGTCPGGEHCPTIEE